MTDKDCRIEQVKRILALMYNATYPGKGMWRFRVTCEMIARGANAEAEIGANSICESEWFAAAVEILKMSPKNACYDWNCFSPREMTEIAREFLKAAKALVLWVDAERKNDAEDQEIDYRSIGFMPEHPGRIVLEKLGGYENGPTLTMVKELLFTENRFRDVVYNPLLFEQFEHVIEASGAEMEYEEPTNEADIQECDAVIRALCEDRAEREHRQDEGIPSLNSRTFQSVMDDLSASNEAFLEKEKAEMDALCKKIDAKFGDFLGFGTPKSAVDAEKLAADRKAPVTTSANTTDWTDGNPTGEPAVPLKTENYSRFKVEWFSSELRVTDAENFPENPYHITPVDGNAAKAALVLIRDYGAGNAQTHKSSRRWIGAFQSGRGDATRFRKEQIFKLPGWNGEKQRWIQYDGRWRLWTDDEMQLTEGRRLANFKAAHPHGYGA